MIAVVATLSVVVVLLAVLVAGLLRSHAEILRRLHELDPGAAPDVGTVPSALPIARHEAPTAAVDVSGIDPHGDAISVTVAGRRHRTLLAFLSSGCATCHPFWDVFASAPAAGLPADIRLVAVTRGDDAESRAGVEALAGRATVVMSSMAWDDYGAPGAPYFVLVAHGRVVGQGTGRSWDQVRRLLGEAIGDANLASVASVVSPSTVDLAADERDREARIDAALLDAGLHPGHPSLYQPGA
jgi:hypothetical protein